ncbi:hypothetical protein ELS19_01355 [Halogeometricum borinquense]|uniref:Uncharacterized protein n=1 Tax=Halogeometricum borinquense TaxID=60847 RepID=A0A482T7E8_9EURY|nr:hypothetical protein [Halogeometricum borinquense]RYJ12747.1 hypothetical protein ELS19_01355 [Halogeometricum borinquense]
MTEFDFFGEVGRSLSGTTSESYSWSPTDGELWYVDSLFAEVSSGPYNGGAFVKLQLKGPHGYVIAEASAASEAQGESSSTAAVGRYIDSNFTLEILVNEDNKEGTYTAYTLPRRVI